MIFWSGWCHACNLRYEIDGRAARALDLAADPGTPDHFDTECPACTGPVHMQRWKSGPLRHMIVLPAETGCPDCGVDHQGHVPHNATSVQYQYRFYAEHHRWPSWRDAMAHCDDETRELWTQALVAKGIDIDTAGGLPTQETADTSAGIRP